MIQIKYRMMTYLKSLWGLNFLFRELMEVIQPTNWPNHHWNIVHLPSFSEHTIRQERNKKACYRVENLYPSTSRTPCCQTMVRWESREVNMELQIITIDWTRKKMTLLWVTHKLTHLKQAQMQAQSIQSFREARSDLRIQRDRRAAPRACQTESWKR